MSSTMKKKNSKGQIIEELDPPLEKVEPNPPDNFAPLFVKVVPKGEAEDVEPNQQDNFATPVPSPKVDKVLQSEELNCNNIVGLAPPFLKVEDKEILDWCERYLAAKKNNLYTLYDLYKFYKS